MATVVFIIVSDPAAILCGRSSFLKAKDSHCVGNNDFRLVCLFDY